MLQVLPHTHHQITDRIHGVIINLDRLFFSPLNALLIVLVSSELVDRVLLQRAQAYHVVNQEFLHSADSQLHIVLSIPHDHVERYAREQALDLFLEALRTWVNEHIKRAVRAGPRCVQLIKRRAQIYEVLRIFRRAPLFAGLAAAVVILSKAVKPVLVIVQSERLEGCSVLLAVVDSYPDHGVLLVLSRLFPVPVREHVVDDLINTYRDPEPHPAVLPLVCCLQSLS